MSTLSWVREGGSCGWPLLPVQLELSVQGGTSFWASEWPGGEKAVEEREKEKNEYESANDGSQIRGGERE